MVGNLDRDLAGLSASISRSRVSAIRVVSVIGLASTDFVAVDLLNTIIEGSVRVRLASRSPGKSDETSSVVVSRPFYRNGRASLSNDGSTGSSRSRSVARSQTVRSSTSSRSLFLVTSRSRIREVGVSKCVRNESNKDQTKENGLNSNGLHRNTDK